MTSAEQFNEMIDAKCDEIAARHPGAGELTFTEQHGPCGCTLGVTAEDGRRLGSVFLGAPYRVGTTSELGYNANPLYTPPAGVR